MGNDINFVLLAFTRTNATAKATLFIFLFIF